MKLGVVALVALGAPDAAQAGAGLLNGLGGAVGYGPSSLAPGDDSTSSAIPLASLFPQGINYYGTNQATAFVNNNGNVTLGAAMIPFTPQPLPFASVPTIAPMAVDVDTRNQASPTGVYWVLDASHFVVTWHDVGYYSMHADKVNDFQMIMTPAGAAGDFDLEFRFGTCQWTSGDASGGNNGLGGTAGTSGLDAGDAHRFLALPGSSTANLLNLCSDSNVGNAGVWELKVRGGIPSLCGNGVKEGVEECDGADAPMGVTCKSDCTLPSANGAQCMMPIECASGFCVSGICCNVACDAGVCQACTKALGAVADGTCTNLTGPVCDDQDACTAVDTCMAGICVGAAPKACPPPDDCHEAGTCAPATGQCAPSPPKSDGEACNAGAGKCMGGTCEALPSASVGTSTSTSSGAAGGMGGGAASRDAGGGCAVNSNGSREQGGAALTLIAVAAFAARSRHRSRSRVSCCGAGQPSEW